MAPRIRGRAIPFLVAVSLLGLTSISLARIPDDRSSGELRVIRSDQQSLVFEYRPEYHERHTVRTGASEFIRFDFDGSSPFASEGDPDIGSALFSAAFPSESGHAVQVIEADYEDIPNVTLAPVPALTEQEGVVTAGVMQTNRDAYTASGFRPENIAVLAQVGRVRSMFIGTIRVTPVQYDAARRTVRKYSRIVVEVAFGRPAGARVSANDADLFGDMLLNREVGRSWQFGNPARQSLRGGSSVLAAGSWYRIPVTKEGVYIIDALYLQAAGIDRNSFDPRTLKIYGNGGAVLPEFVGSPRAGDLVENAIFVQGESDGVFQENDFVVFYARPTRSWNYNPVTKLFDHTNHLYTETNYYWLTFGGANGKRMPQTGSLTDPPDIVPTHFTGLTAIDEDTLNILGSGKDWYGPLINPNATITYARELPGLIPNLSRTYRISFAYRTVGVGASLTVTESGTTIRTEGLLSIPTGNEFQIALERTMTITSSAPLTGTTSTVSLRYGTIDPAGSGWLSWMEIQYPRSFAATGNYLRFRSPDTTGVVEYNLTGFTAQPLLFDVTDHANVSLISGATGTYTFRAAADSGVVREYCAVAAGAYVVPGAPTPIGNQDLRGITEGYEFIIVTSPEYRSAANRLAGHREQEEFGGLSTLIVEVDQIYNEFSGGLPDVTAIRDFLKYAVDTWTTPPTFVLFFGQGSFDYKGRFGFKSSFVPTWQSLESRHDLTSYASDDFLVKFGETGSSPWIVSGRLNPRTSAEAEFLVDKLIAYDTGSVKDPWKLRLLIVGDDSWTPEREDGSIHSTQAESLAESHAPDEMEKRKIFIAEYPTTITAQGRRKPGAYQAIIDEINKGVLIVNYTGHGNPTVWAHEQIFNVQTSVPSLVNDGKLAVFFLATCNFSDFDDPNSYTGSELLLNRAGGGAIGCLSATRKVFAVENFNLNVEIYDRMFLQDQYGRAIVDRPATALFRSKVENTNSLNDQKFFFMGDPTMRLQYPEGFVSIDTINGEPVDSVNGIPRADSDPIQVRALQRVTLGGVTRTIDNLPEQGTTGLIELVVNDATRSISIPGFPPGAATPFSYKATGATIYRGAASVSNGNYGAEFIVPKDISYADSTTRGRMIAYYTDATSDRLGYTDNIYVGGTDSAAAEDTEGPEIIIFLDSRSFKSGDVVSHDPLLLVDLADSSGINTSTAGIGHRIEAWLNGASQSVDITDAYASELDNFRRGTVQYELRDLPFGRNSIVVRAWDAYNNASTAETFFDVTSGDQLSISDVMNYPNPFARETMFTFRQNQLVPLNIILRIYTVAGRLIQTIETASPGEPFVKIPWDGRDRDGDVLANGVYLYKIVVSTVDGAYSSEALGKLAVLK